MFNHLSHHIDTAFRFGGDYDGNGWIFWEWAGYVTREHQGYPLLEPKLGFRYFTLRWGTLVEYADADNDGIPDDAPDLPVDEKRLHSDPAKVDTDGDGLSDMMEVMACRWVEFGGNYTWAGNPKGHYCDLRNPDTDGDGLKDGMDPYPFYAINPNIKKAAKAKGPLGWADLQKLIDVKDKAYTGTFYLGWNDDYLVIGLKAPVKPRFMQYDIDVDDDGWFSGAGNYQVEIHPYGGARHGDDWKGNDDGTLIYGLWNGSPDDNWPFFDIDGFATGDLTLRQDEADGQYWCLLQIPKNGRNGLELVAGEKIGILLGILPEGGIQRKWDCNKLSVFEPNGVLAFTLVD